MRWASVWPRWDGSIRCLPPSSTWPQSWPFSSTRRRCSRLARTQTATPVMRDIINRPDGRPIRVTRTMGQLFVCADACCCGRRENGHTPVPRELYQHEWERRRLRNRVHLTIGGCLGPCALANVVMVLFEGRQAWFHSMSRAEQVLPLYDWIEELVEARQWTEPPAALAPYRFTASTWEAPADGD